MAKDKQGKLGLLDTTTILVGGMIGSAIFSLSGVTMAQAGPASIISWIIAAIILFAFALLTAELATMFPHSGGVFVFPAKTLGKTEKQGKLWGWIAAWAYIFGCIAGAAFSAYFVGDYLANAIPALRPYVIYFALAAVLFAGIVNVSKITAMGKINTGLTIGLAVTMLLFVGVAFFSGKWDAATMSPFFTQGSGGTLGFMSAIPIAMVAFGAIVAAAYMVGEIKNPRKTIPKAMALAMTIVVILYIAMITATLGLITADFLNSADGMGFQWAPMTAAAIFSLSSTPWLVPVITIAAILALLTTIIVVMALAGRTLEASAESGILPRFLSKKSEKTNMPVNAQLVVMVIVGIFASIPNAMWLIVNFGALCNAIVIAIICVTIVVARKKNPDAEDIFRAPGGNILPIITLIVIIAAYVPDILNGGWQLWAYTAGYFVIGLVIYFLGNLKKKA